MLFENRNPSDEDGGRDAVEQFLGAVESLVTFGAER